MKRLNKGSALLVTLLIMVILTLTGISFLFMADTENKISNNYYMAMRALLAAQSGVYMVNSWFNHAKDTITLLPTANDLTFVPRPYTSDTLPNPQAENTTLYKWGCQAPNANCTNYLLFDRPYIGTNGTSSVYHRFFGTEDNPDIIISYDNNNSVNYLNNLNTLLLGTATGPIRISEIRLYSPPVSPNPSQPWDPKNTAYGICTAQITAETVRRNPDGTVAEVLSTRRVKGIITDINFAIAGVAMDVDGTINQNGAVRVNWGIMKATQDIVDNNVQHLSTGSPVFVNTKGISQLCGTLFGTFIDGVGTQPLQGQTLQDPWHIVRSKTGISYQKHALNIPASSCTGSATQAPGNYLITPPLTTSNLSCDYVYNETLTPSDQRNRIIKYRQTANGTWYHDCKECNGRNDSPECGISTADCYLNQSDVEPTDFAYSSNKYYNIIGCDPTVGFANAFRGYNYWKNIITTVVKQGGGTNIYYLVPSGARDQHGTLIGLCGSGLWGPPNDATNCKDFETWTSGKEGFWFFDTTDGRIPQLNGTNIAAEVSVKGQYWSAGVQYICAQLYDSAGGGNNDFPNCKFPGEPLWENPDPHYCEFRNGVYDAKDTDGNFIDRFLNLRYPADRDYKSFNFVVDANAESSDLGTTKGWDKYGPTFTFTGYYKGILYLTGSFWARGNRDFYGSVMIWNSDSRSSGNVEVWYNPELQEGITQNLPTAFVEQIITDM